MIENFLNFIRKCETNYFSNDFSDYDLISGKKLHLEFDGDGYGDFESHGERDCTEECLKAYVKQCKQQIELAKEALKLKKEGKL